MKRGGGKKRTGWEDIRVEKWDERDCARRITTENAHLTFF